jgi:hypothetical protein
MNYRKVATKFPLGRVVTTPNAANEVAQPTLLAALARHANGDWGEVHADDVGANDRALKAGDRLLSVYPITPESSERFWIITEADRSSTTILLPEDY